MASTVAAFLSSAVGDPRAAASPAQPKRPPALIRQGVADATEKPATDAAEVENGGSGSATSIQASEKQKTKLDNRALFRPVIIQSAAVLEAVKARPGNVEVCLYGGATADLDSFCARRRAPHPPLRPVRQGRLRRQCTVNRYALTRAMIMETGQRLICGFSK
jgi:hypothetical protein